MATSETEIGLIEGPTEDDYIRQADAHRHFGCDTVDVAIKAAIELSKADPDRTKLQTLRDLVYQIEQDFHAVAAELRSQDKLFDGVLWLHLSRYEITPRMLDDSSGGASFLNVLYELGATELALPHRNEEVLPFLDAVCAVVYTWHRAFDVVLAGDFQAPEWQPAHDLALAVALAFGHHYW
ncbi:MAG: hypothetical protein Q7S64_01730 [bacterium]|nr:hypothetical protein [bacterium]